MVMLGADYGPSSHLLEDKEELSKLMMLIQSVNQD